MDKYDLLLNDKELTEIDAKVARDCLINPCPNSPSKKPFIDSSKFVKLSNEARLKAQLKKVVEYINREMLGNWRKLVDDPHADLPTENSLIAWEEIKKIAGVE